MERREGKERDGYLSLAPGNVFALGALRVDQVGCSVSEISHGGRKVINCFLDCVVFLELIGSADFILNEKTAT